MNARLFLLPAFGFLLAACEQGGEISSGFDPLDPAGGGGAGTRVVDSGFRPGEFVSVSVPNTGFYKSRPKGEADADKLLPAGTQAKVISDDGSFVKVELDSGELGYVSTVQVMGEGETVVAPYSGDEIQVYPPTGDIIPLGDVTEVDPDVPVVPPTIDPDAPVDVPLLPDEATDPATDVPPLPEPVTPDPVTPDDLATPDEPEDEEPGDAAE